MIPAELMAAKVQAAVAARRRPDFLIIARTASTMDDALRRGELYRQAGADVYSPHYSGCDPELVELMHEAGATVGVWTVDDAAAIAWVRVCRPDSVFSNRPAEVGPALRDA